MLVAYSGGMSASVQTLPSGAKISVRFAAKQRKSSRSAYGQFAPSVKKAGTSAPKRDIAGGG